MADRRRYFFRNAIANDNRRQQAAKRKQTELTEHGFVARRHSSEGNSKRPIPSDEGGEGSGGGGSAGPSTKEQRTETSTHAGMATHAGNDTIDVEMADQPTAASGGMASNSGGGMRGTASFPIGIRQVPASYTRVYSKQYNIRIFNRLDEYRTPTINGVQWNDYIPNAHEIPCHHLAFYLSHSEMQRLRGKTKVVVEEANVDVANHTAIISYETNASGTQIGNNNLGITLYQLDPNIVKARTGVALLTQQAEVIRNVFWGVDHNSLPVSVAPSSAMPGIGAEFITRNYNNRFCYRSVRSVGTRAHNGVPWVSTPMQFYNVKRHVVKRENVSITEGPFTSWSYKPVNGIVMAQNYGIMPPGAVSVAGPAYNVRDSHTLRWRGVQPLQGVGASGMPGTRVGQPITTVIQPIGNVTNDIWRNAANGVQDLTRILIDDPYINGGHASAKIPVLVIGMDPQIGIVEATNAVAAVPCHVDLIITCHIRLRITEGIDYDDSNHNQAVEVNWKYPEWRYQLQQTENTMPLLMSGPMHQQNSVAAEMSGNPNVGNVAAPQIWDYPPAVTPVVENEAEGTEKEQLEVLDKAIKSLADEKIYPYMTRSSTKKHYETLKEELGKKKTTRKRDLKQQQQRHPLQTALEQNLAATPLRSAVNGLESQSLDTDSDEENLN